MEENVKDMYLLVVGSRSIESYEYVRDHLDKLLEKELSGYHIVVVSGGASGVDSLAELWANNNGFDRIIMKADWNFYGKKAGYIRNEKMHKFISDKDNRLVVAFWDGKSKGTKHNFGLAEKYNNKIIVYMDGNNG